MDPDRHILKGGEGWIQGYTANAVVNGHHHLIVAISVRNQPSDVVHLLPILERIEENNGGFAGFPDCGWGVLHHRQPGDLRAKRSQCQRCAQQSATRPESKPIAGGGLERPRCSRRKNRNHRFKGGPAIDVLRKMIVEPVFGPIKRLRRLNHCLQLVLANVNGEWSLMTTAHNIVKPLRVSMGRV